MDLDLTKSQFNILLQAITQVSTQVDDLRAEMRRDFLSKEDFKKEMKKYATKDDLKKFTTKEYFHKELKKELKNTKNEIIEEITSAIQPPIANLEDTAEHHGTTIKRHGKALKKAGLLR